MNKIEEQLTSALRRQDAELTVHDELDAIINDDHIVRFSSQRSAPNPKPRPPRMLHNLQCPTLRPRQP